MSTPAPRPAHVQAAVNMFETLSVEAVAQMGQIYTSDAYFKDPFNEVRDIASIQRIFEHMFTQVNTPRFVVTSVIAQGQEAFLVWDFLFTMKRFDTSTVQCIKGSSHLKFADNGQIVYHRDYWDAAEELYEKIPVLGGIMRALKRHASK